jgi:hypothetical protein
MLKNFYILPVLLLFAASAAHAQPGFCKDITRVPDAYVRFQTPDSKKIIFSKEFRKNEVYAVQLFACGEDAGLEQKGVRIIFSNGKEISHPDVPLTITMTRSNKTPFNYTTTFELTPEEIRYFMYYSIKEFKLANHSCEMDNDESAVLTGYFNCLLGKNEEMGTR